MTRSHTHPASALDRQRLTAVARGEAPADLCITGATLYCAFTRSWFEGALSIVDGHIATYEVREATTTIDATGSWLVPGFIDAHVHIESSMMVPREFAEAVVPHGTTTIIADPHEIANVLGPQGVEWMLDASDDLPLDVLMMAPSCVPASQFESSGGAITAADIGRLVQHPRVLGVGEMMNFPGVVAGAAGELDKLIAAGGAHADGHAPGVSGSDLDAYIAAGITSDHECTTAAEVADRIRRGMWVLLREAANARNLLDLLEHVRAHGPDFCALCTDDREPDMLIRDGHIDQMIRLAVANGVSLTDALVMATLNAARAHRLTDRGALAPGMRADIVQLTSLDDLSIAATWSRGILSSRNGATEAHPRPGSGTLESTVHILDGDRFSAEHLRCDIDPSNGRVRAIGAHDGQLLTDCVMVDPPVENGALAADPQRDLALIAVVERHRATGRVGHGLVSGFGLRDGAIASSVAHDAHNVVVVGADRESMATCVRRIVELGGGQVAARGNDVIAELPLPVAGLMSDRPATEVASAFEAVSTAARDLGCPFDAPMTCLSFLALSVIPALKLTDRGLVDVDSFEIVPLQEAPVTTAPTG